MGRKHNLGSECVAEMTGAGAGRPPKDDIDTSGVVQGALKASSDRMEGDNRTPEARALLELMIGLSQAGTVNDLATSLSNLLYDLVPFDIGCIRWAPLDTIVDDWALDAQREDLTESIVFDHMGGLIEDWEGNGAIGRMESEGENGQPAHVSEVFRFRTRDGDLTSLRIRSLLMVPLNSHGAMVGTLDLMSARATALPRTALSELGTVWDAVGRRLGELLEREALVSDRERVRTLLDGSDDLLVVWRNDGSFWEVDCNARTEELMDRGNIDPDRMEGPFFVPDGSDRERAEAAWRRAFTKGEGSMVDLNLLDKGGRSRGFLCGFSPILKDGAINGVRMTGVDMEKMASGLRSIEGVNKVNRLLLSVLSTDLKDPLSALMGYSELLMEGTALSPEQELYILRMMGMVKRINDTIDQTKLLTMLSEGKVPGEFERRDLSRTVQKCLDQLHPRTQHYDIVFQRKDSDLELYCSSLIEQVILNLVDNAMRFSPPDSRITLDLSTDIEGITFSVRDEGAGVPERYRTSIFKRFWGGGPDDGIQGVGLGLAVSKGIVELHRGRIWVEDSKPHGSVFKFFLPWVPDP